MIQKEKLIQWLGVSGDRKMKVQRILDQAEQALKRHEAVFTDFLSPDMIDDAVKCLTQVHGLSFYMDGGYPDAEYQVLALCPDWMEEDMVDFPLALVHVEKLQQKKDLGHRDVHGSVLGLGINRPKIGDLIVWGDVIQIITDREMASFLGAHLVKIGSTSVRPSVESLTALQLKEPEYQVVSGTVKSLRLDAIIATGFHLSRGKAADLVRGEKVKVNYRPVTNPSMGLKEGDLVSVRGKGRLIYDGDGGTSKKDRIHVRLRLVK